MDLVALHFTANRRLFKGEGTLLAENAPECANCIIIKLFAQVTSSI